jgi:hypothetical protein
MTKSFLLSLRNFVNLFGLIFGKNILVCLMVFFSVSSVVSSFMDFTKFIALKHQMGFDLVEVYSNVFCKFEECFPAGLYSFGCYCPFMECKECCFIITVR